MDENNINNTVFNLNNKSMESGHHIIEQLLSIPRPPIHHHQQQQQQPQTQQHLNNSANIRSSRYTELLHVIADLSQHIRPSYAGHRGSSEKVKQGITRARVLVRECLIETERNGR